VSTPLRPWRGLAYRAHDPRWSFDPASGEGARLKGGRFNRIGTPALYLALHAEGAMRAAQAGFPFRFQPMTLCAYEVTAERIFDAGDAAAMAELGVDPADLACPWRLDLAEGRVRRSWRLADRLTAQGADGMLAPSFAVAVLDGDVNLVLWRWGTSGGASVRVIDEEGRLPRSRASRGR
jgi:RES domain-containing protein